MKDGKISKKICIALLINIIFILSFSIFTNAQYYEDDYTEEEAEDALIGLFGMGLTLCLIFYLIPIVAGILLTAWLYKDANKRGKEGVVWAIIMLLITLSSLIFGFFSLIIMIIIAIIWLAIRPPIGGIPYPYNDRICPNCGRAIPTDARTCPYCRVKF